MHTPEIRNPKSEMRNAFSLVELLVVIGIIILLVGILSPSIGRAIEMSYKAKTVAAIQEISSGAQQYKSDNNYFPGQRNASLLGSTFTGSQMLAICMFEWSDADGDGNREDGEGLWINGNNIDGTPVANYISYTEDKLANIAGRPYSLSDRWPRKAMAILYYPARLGNDGTIDSAFSYGDNSVYGNGAQTAANFQRAIWDDRFDANGNYDGTGDKAFKADSFLLVGPGINRTYFETDNNDDVNNFD